jgi:DNA-binding FadR family transcriptional regulator
MITVIVQSLSLNIAELRVNWQARPRADDFSRPQSISRQVVEAFLSKALAPGQRLGTKEELRTEWDVSVGTLNEALAILQAGGMIELRPGPGGGVFVAERPSLLRLGHSVLNIRGESMTVAEAIVVRDTLDPLVAAEAATHCTPADAAELTARLHELKESVGEDPTAWLRSNWELHRRIAEICTNRVLVMIYTGLLDYVTEELELVSRGSKFTDSPEIYGVHDALVKAIIEGRVEDARATAVHHADVTRANSSIPPHGATTVTPAGVRSSPQGRIAVDGRARSQRPTRRGAPAADQP